VEIPAGGTNRGGLQQKLWKALSAAGTKEDEVAKKIYVFLTSLESVPLRQPKRVTQEDSAGGITERCSAPKLTYLPFRGFSSRSGFQHHLIASGSHSSRGYLCVWAVLAQPEMNRIFRPSGGDSQGIRAYPSKEDFEAAQGTGSGAAIYRLDEPTRLSLGMVASCRVRFRFLREGDCRSTTGLNFRIAR